MEKKKLFLISAGIGLVAVFLVNSYISSQRDELLKLSSPIEVVVVARDLAEGTRLQDDMLETISVPKSFVQPDVVKSFEDVRDRQIAVPMLKGTQLLGSMIALNQNVGLAQKIPKDSLAMAVPVNNSTGVAGLIQPGDIVDISLTVEVVKKPGIFGPNGGEAEVTEMVSKQILSKVQVLAVDQRSHRSRAGAGIITSSNQKGSGFAYANGSGGSRSSNSSATTVTFELNPEQVAKLSLAQELGSISLALHSSWSDKEQATSGKKIEVSEFELLGIDKPIKRNSVDVFYGANRKR